MKKIIFVLLALVLVFAISCTPEVEHKHTNIEKVLVKEPTDKEEGLYNRVCKDCKEVVDTEVIAKLNYPVEIYIPEDVELEEMDDSLVDFMKKYIKGEVENEIEIKDNSTAHEYTVYDVVFKENAVVDSHVVSDGCGSIKYELIDDVSLSYYIDATVILTYSDEKNGNYKIAMNFRDALITAEWDETEERWVNPKLADEDTFDCKIVPLDLFSATNLYPSDQELWDFCDAVFSVEDFNNIFTDYDAVYTTIKTATDENGSVVFNEAFVTLFGSEEYMEFLDFFNEKVKVGEKEYDMAYCIDDAKTLNIKYLRIDGKFYNPEKLNKALSGSEE